ncbi:MAG: acetyltransferase [Lachnospiraceae bacterium]|nr:acetyltransferase [Lachnospiraceae bacterium]
MERLIMIGAGGHAESVADSIDSSLYKLVGFIDSNKTGEHMGLPILGKDITEVSNYHEYVYFVSIGDVVYRENWFNRLIDLGLSVINIIDKTALISKTATIGVGNFVGKLAIINAGTKVGDNNVINTKALIEHECRIGSHTHLSTNSTINGDVIVEDSVFLGSTAVCNGQLKIGCHSIIGSGSVVIKDVEPWTTVVGTPARVVKRREPNG